MLGSHLGPNLTAGSDDAPAESESHMMLYQDTQA